MTKRLAMALSIMAFVLMFAWNFVPADVAFRGDTIRCWPASVDRSSPPSDVSERVLACRPTATRRELQGFGGVAVALLLIWGTYTATNRRDVPGQGSDGGLPSPELPWVKPPKEGRHDD